MGCGNAPQNTPAEEPADSLNLDSLEGVHALSLSDGSRVIWLQDNEGEKLNSPDLFSDAPAGLIDSLGLSEGIPASVSTFLLQTDGKNILFDAGLGNMAHGQLLNRLASVGLGADQIDYLYLTHFHGDHIGGMLNGDELVFANAEVYAGQVEYDAWMAMPEEQNALQKKTMEAYKDKLHLFQFNDTLPCGVVALDAIGHTPGHTAFQKGDLLVIGDLFHGLALQENHTDICSNYDMDKTQAAASRKRILDYAREHHLHMAGMHLPGPGFFE